MELHKKTFEYIVGYKTNIRIAELFPELRVDEQNVAVENLDRYLELAWEIYLEMQSRDG